MYYYFKVSNMLLSFLCMGTCVHECDNGCVGLRLRVHVTLRVCVDDLWGCHEE